MGNDAPEFLAIGHVTRDLLPGESGGGWRVGGTVTFAALTAARLGLRPGVVTSGTPTVIAELRRMLPDAALVSVPAAEATAFENLYEGGVRRQFLRGRAASIGLEAVPAEWRAAPIVLLAPLAREVDPRLAADLAQRSGALVAATPQGWLRRWHADGAVYSGALDVAPAVLPHLDTLILSREDLGAPEAAGDLSPHQRGPAFQSGKHPTRGNELPAHAPMGLNSQANETGGGLVIEAQEAEAQIATWSKIVPIVVVTRGPDGALLYLDGNPPEAFPGYAAREVDPTGAGDVFAAAFLCRLRATGDPRAAADFANRVAALSVEGEGILGIPTRTQLLARYPNGI
jgi:sugar/nucleoside kinase (ribokinase family)